MYSPIDFMANYYRKLGLKKIEGAKPKPKCNRLELRIKPNLPNPLINSKFLMDFIKSRVCLGLEVEVRNPPAPLCSPSQHRRTPHCLFLSSRSLVPSQRTQTLIPESYSQASSFDALVAEEKSNLPAKERWLGCEHDGYSYVMDALFSSKTKAGAAAFFFVLSAISTEEVEVSIVGGPRGILAPRMSYHLPLLHPLVPHPHPRPRPPLLPSLTRSKLRTWRQ